MARGTGKAAQQAVQSGKLSAFVDAQGSANNGQWSSFVADWSEVNGNLIVGAVVAVNGEGGSLLLGHTRDNKSYSVMVFFGDAKKPYYFNGDSDGVVALETFLLGLAELSG